MASAHQPSQLPHPRVAEPKSPSKPPTHLRAPTRRWFASVVDDYDLEPHHVGLLQAACEAWHRMQEARHALKRDGSYVEGRYGLRAHPALCNISCTTLVLWTRADSLNR